MGPPPPPWWSAIRPIIPHDLPLLRVDDCRESLIAMAQWARARSSARIVAITGSVGKTTCKAMLARILQRHGQ